MMSRSIIKQGVRHQAKITLTLNSEMMEQVKKESGKKAMPVSTWVRAALVAYLLDKVSGTSAKVGNALV